MIIKLRNINFPHNDVKIAVAVSGGIDSMCLAYLATLHYSHDLAKITILIVDHGLRPESAQEANKTKEFLIGQGLRVEILNWEGAKPTANIHQKAREARYCLMLDYCKRQNIGYLLTAHNLNDQAETVLLRIYRGSGIDGISGIPNETIKNGVTILRPLINCARQHIEATIAESNWPYVTDPSNYNPRFERTRIRNLLSQLDEQNLWLSRLNILAENASRVRRFLESETRKTLAKTVVFSDLGYASLDYETLLTFDEEIIYRVLVHILNKVSGHKYPPRFKSLKRLLQAIIKGDNSLTTLWGCEIKKKKDRLIIFREQVAIEPARQPSVSLIWDHRFEVHYLGGFVAPINLAAWQNLKKQTNLKLPFQKILYTLPAIYDGNGTLIATPFFNNQGYFRLL